ncbi:TPA: alanine racemase [Candidatus Gastranaerophilales bacterium HUM_9]|nr:MAG TPA: alanine racemase [Candidatus Gastranaerophilales bacterium HUM_9]HBX35756.1 alanine racemase [Cyanobacteria bacterium UBA11440]
MKNIRQSQINIHRDAWVEINLESIAHNIREFRKNIPADKKMLGIVKADAYGHGSIMTAPIMLASGIDMLGVASIDEGLDLRNEKISCDILVVGAVPVWSFEVATENDISISIFSEAHLNACKQAYERTGIKPKVHIKLNTGMNRIGLEPENAVEFIKKAQTADYLDLKGIFTHLANAEDIEKTEKQFEIWNRITNAVDTKGLLLHALNTAGSMKYYDEIKSNMVRMGIAIYGLEPDLPEGVKFKPELKQVMGLKGRITNIHMMKKGQGISYGYSYVADKDIKVATIPIGYADGVPRALSNKIFAELNGYKIKQIGNITMDQMMFDITGIDATEGDIITLLNDSDKDLSIDNWAKIVGTINYELTCRLKVRLPRVYVR